MIRRFEGLQQVEVTVNIKDKTFIRAPTDQQRGWLIDSALNEFGYHLKMLDERAQKVASSRDESGTASRMSDIQGDQEFMQDWQLPLMQEMAKKVARSHGHVLEIGFGSGVSAAMIQDEGVRSHTIIEDSDLTEQLFEEWRKDYGASEFNMVNGLWQDTLPEMGKFDGIFFHASPKNEDDWLREDGGEAFSEHFYDIAASHLEPGGVFAYVANEIDSLSRTHQRSLLERFSRIETQVVRGLEIPEDVIDMRSDSLVVVAAVK